MRRKKFIELYGIEEWEKEKERRLKERVGEDEYRKIKKKETNRRYYNKHKEEIKEQKKQYYQSNREKYDEYREQYIKRKVIKKQIIIERCRELSPMTYQDIETVATENKTTIPNILRVLDSQGVKIDCKALKTTDPNN